MLFFPSIPSLLVSPINQGLDTSEDARLKGDLASGAAACFEQLVARLVRPRGVLPGVAELAQAENQMQSEVVLGEPVDVTTCKVQVADVALDRFLAVTMVIIYNDASISSIIHQT